MANLGLSVGELRTILDQFSDDDLVVLSADPEGNRFAVATGWDDVLVGPGDMYPEVYESTQTVTETLERYPDAQIEKAPEEAVKAVRLWPGA